MIPKMMAVRMTKIIIWLHVVLGSNMSLVDSITELVQPGRTTTQTKHSEAKQGSDAPPVSHDNFAQHCVPVPDH